MQRPDGSTQDSWRRDLERSDASYRCEKSDGIC